MVKASKACGGHDGLTPIGHCRLKFLIQ